MGLSHHFTYFGWGADRDFLFPSSTLLFSFRPTECLKKKNTNSSVALYPPAKNFSSAQSLGRNYLNPLGFIDGDARIILSLEELYDN